jgi:hypothetical protein
MSVKFPRGLDGREWRLIPDPRPTDDGDGRYGPCVTSSVRTPYDGVQEYGDGRKSFEFDNQMFI